VFAVAIVVIGVFLSMPAFAPPSDWTVTWYPVQEGITTFIYNVSIQNLKDTAQDFNLSLLIENTSFPSGNLSGIGIYEWKNITRAGWKLQANGSVQHDDWIAANSTWNNWTETTYANTSITTYAMEWKAAKSGSLDSRGKLNAGSINIPKSGSKAKDGTVNGTKWFQVRFNAPVVLNGAGWGSRGRILLIEEGQGYAY
jgi:hypothetical protein